MPCMYLNPPEKNSTLSCLVLSSKTKSKSKTKTKTKKEALKPTTRPIKAFNTPPPPIAPLCDQKWSAHIPPSAVSSPPPSPHPPPHPLSPHIPINTPPPSPKAHLPMASSSPHAPPPSRGRLPPPIWSHDETLALIESYRQKWQSLRRANLRAADWDDVASDLSNRSPLLPSKTPVQCRHKIEKLRKRFRSDRRRSLEQNPQSPPTSSWPFFPLMESLDCPPIPNGELLRFVIPKAVRSKVVNPSSGVGKMKAAGFADVGVKPVMEEMRRRMERKRKEMELGTEDGMDGMVVAMRMVGDGFMRLERVKLDMVRETEKMRMEMELKRTEMILDSQQRIVDAFVKGVVGGVRRKKGKVSTDSRVSDE